MPPFVSLYAHPLTSPPLLVLLSSGLGLYFCLSCPGQGRHSVKSLWRQNTGQQFTVLLRDRCYSLYALTRITPTANQAARKNRAPAITAIQCRTEYPGEPTPIAIPAKTANTEERIDPSRISFSVIFGLVSFGSFNRPSSFPRSPEPRPPGLPPCRQRPGLLQQPFLPRSAV